MQPKIAVKRAPTWRESANMVRCDKATMRTGEVARKHGMTAVHVCRLQRISAALGEKIMADPRLDAFTLVEAFKLADMPPMRRAKAIAEKKKAKRPSLKIDLVVSKAPILPSERAKLIAGLKAKGIEGQKIAQDLGVDPGAITLWATFSRYIPAIQRAIDAGHITLFAARAVMHMSAPGQAFIWTTHREDFAAMSGRDLQAMIREKYSPKLRPEFYADPETASQKERERARGRAKPHRVVKFPAASPARPKPSKAA